MKSRILVPLGLSLSAIVAMVVAVFLFSSGGHNPIPIVVAMLGLISLAVVSVLVLVFRKFFSTRPNTIYALALAVPLAIVVGRFGYQYFPLKWSGTVSDVHIANITSEIKKDGRTGLPIAVVLKYEVTVTDHWRGNPRPTLDWRGYLVINENNLFYGGFHSLEGKVSPEPIVLHPSLPPIYSTFGFVPGTNYRFEFEFAPPFLHVANWQHGEAFRCLRESSFGAGPEEREKTFHSLQVSASNQYRVTIALSDHRHGSRRHVEDIEILPILDLYRGLQASGIPRCAEDSN